MKSSRQYRSEVRNVQKEQTRQKILDALAEAITRPDFTAVTMAEIAKAAGVGEATLYRHFPNREVLLDGLVEQFDHVMGDLPYPQTLDDLTVLVERSFTAFDRNPALVRAFLVSQLGRTARQQGRPRRIQAIQRVLASAVHEHTAAQQRAAEAVIAHLSSIQTWQSMTEEFSMSGAEVGQAVSWAIGVLVCNLQSQSQAKEE